MILDWVARTLDGREFNKADLRTVEELRKQPIVAMFVHTSFGYMTIEARPEESIHLFTRVMHTLGEGPVHVPCAEIKDRETGHYSRVFLHPQRGIIFSTRDS